MLSFEKYINIDYTTSIAYNKDYTSQKIFTSITPIISQAKFGTIYTQINFSVGQKYKTMFYPSSLSYNEAWTKSLIDMYSPGKKNAENRAADIKFLFNYFANEEDKTGIRLSGLNFEAFSKTNFQNKKQKETQKMIDALKKGDKIVTIGGIHGTISSTKEQTVIVKVDENTKIEFSRSAIASVITDKAETASGTEKAGAASEEKGEKKSLFGKIKKDNKKAEESSSEK